MELQVASPDLFIDTAAAQAQASAKTKTGDTSPRISHSVLKKEAVTEGRQPSFSSMPQCIRNHRGKIAVLVTAIAAAVIIALTYVLVKKYQ